MFKLTKVFSLALLAIIFMSGCSVVSDSKERNAATGDLYFWHARAQHANIANDKRDIYVRVEEGTNTYISQKKAEADRCADNIFGGTVDLSAATIPDDLRRDAVSLFGTPGESILDDAWNIVKNLIKDSRKESAEELKARLDGYQLPVLPTTMSAPTTASSH